MNELPTKLKIEPLVDAVFEVRFTDTPTVLPILPGLLYEKLFHEVKELEQLPLSQIPQSLRDSDPALQYAPLNRLNLEDFYINIGDRCISVGCKYPYPGWKMFKPKIVEVMKILNESNIKKFVDRYSLKYVDLLPFIDIRDQILSIDLDLSLGGNKLENNIFHIRMEVPKDDFIHIVQVISSAIVNLHNVGEKQGLIVDIDTIVRQDGVKFEEFFNKLSDRLEVIHDENKSIFFKCLKHETIIKLEPEYD